MPIKLKDERHHPFPITSLCPGRKTLDGLENVGNCAATAAIRRAQTNYDGTLTARRVQKIPHGISMNEGAAGASGAPAAPQAGFEAVIQQAVDHVTAFSATLHEARAAAQLEQALEVRFRFVMSTSVGSCQQRTDLAVTLQLLRTAKQSSSEKGMSFKRPRSSSSSSCMMSRQLRSRALHSTHLRSDSTLGAKYATCVRTCMFRLQKACCDVVRKGDLGLVDRG